MDKLHTLMELILHSKAPKSRGFGVQLSNPSSIQLLQKLGSESIHCALFAHLEKGANSTYLTILFMKIK